MHTSLYEEVRSKYGLERGDSIVGRNVVGRNVQHLHKRDYIRKLTKEAQKADIQKLIAEYLEKLEDKSNKLHAKEHELEQLTKDAAKARSVIQPFRSHKVDFTPPQITEKVPLFGTDKWIERQNRLVAKQFTDPPQITEKVPLFGTDKWIERQNRLVAKQFTEIVRKVEYLYRNDAARQVEAAQRNVLADYRELYQLKRENKILSDTNENLESELNTLLGQLAIPSVRNMIFGAADYNVAVFCKPFS